MSNVTDFLAGNTGGYLGIPYPKPSTEYKEVGNVGMGATVLGSKSYAIEALLLPIAGDPYTHISIKQLNAISLTRGRNAATGSVVWTLNDTTQAGRWANLWFNPVNDDIYVFITYDSVGYSTIKKIVLATTTITTIFTSNTIFNPFANSAGNGVYLAPRDPLNPDTCIWDAVGDGGTVASPYLKHLAMDASNNTEVGTNLTVDPVTPQSVIMPVQYVTADRKIILGGWCSGVNTRGQKVVGFFVMRNATRQYIEMPFDGNLPLVEGYIGDATAIVMTAVNAVELASGSYQYAPIYSLISVLGNSIAFSIKNNSTSNLQTIMGRRLFDRVDFDRWLTAVCDAHNMPTGVGYF